MIKKKLMELLWRIQASQTVIGMIFWPLTITGIFYPYIRERSNNYGFGQNAVFQGMMITFLIIVMGIVIFGLLFDKLRFWKEQNIVAVERNPYNSYKLSPKDIYNLRAWLLAVKANPDIGPETKKQIDFYETWIDFNLKDDPVLCREFENVEAIVMGRQKPPKAAQVSEQD